MLQAPPLMLNIQLLRYVMPIPVVTCHMSLVTCHLSLVTCHLSHVCVCPSLLIACAFSRPTNAHTNPLTPTSHSVSYSHTHCRYGYDRKTFEKVKIRQKVIFSDSVTVAGVKYVPPSLSAPPCLSLSVCVCACVCVSVHCEPLPFPPSHTD